MRRRAFTMIEMVIAVALTGLVVGVVASIFGFASVRLSDSYTQSSLYDQVNAVADHVEETIRQAHSCRVTDAGATLVCSMPQNGVDADGDGTNDTYYPDKVDANGVEQYTVGSYVWYYQSSSGGGYSKSAAATGLVWRAEASLPGDPRASDSDPKFVYYFGGTRLRYPLVTGVTYTVDEASGTVTYTVRASSRIGSQSTETSDVASSRFASITRTVRWRN